jgi:hypothetical protein
MPSLPGLAYYPRLSQHLRAGLPYSAAARLLTNLPSNESYRDDTFEEVVIEREKARPRM